MESYEGSASDLAGFMDKRRRSSLIRRPRDIKGSLDSFTFMPPSTQPHLAPSNEGNSSDNTLKLKLKLGGGGGVTPTKQTNSEAGVYTRATDEGRKLFLDKLKQRCVQKTMYLGEIHGSVNGAAASMTEKSRHILKKRVLDSEQDSDDDDDNDDDDDDDNDDDDDDDDGDEEIRYLEKLKSKRITREYQGDSKEGERGRRINRNGHNMEDREHLTSDKHALTERNKLRMGTVDSFVEGSTCGQVPTTRTRAPIGSGPLEFPDGLPCPSSKRQKQKLSEVEQQSKKAEAAQRRRMQTEKAAQEAEAEAIRKILGQDSGRKKKEEKIKKQQEERAQERATRSSTLASNSVRYIIGPNGTTLTFSEDIGLPDIFKPTCSYPPTREKCVGPNCENSYKYRDSKSKLPLCSLSCYKAIRSRDATTTFDSLLIA